MDIYTIVSGIASICTALISFYLVIIETGDKRKRFFKYRIIEIKRYTAFASLFFAILTIFLQIKTQVDEKLENIQNQTAIIRSLSTAIINSDPISNSKLIVKWSNADSNSYRAFKYYFDNMSKKCLTIHDGLDSYDTSISDSCTEWFNTMHSIDIYFIDSTIYKKNKEGLFEKNLIVEDYRPTDALRKMMKAQMRVYEETRKVKISHHVQFETEYQVGQDYFYGQSEYTVNSGYAINENLAFSNLKDVYCIIALKQPINRININAMSLVNYNQTKTIVLHCKQIFPSPKDNKFDDRIYLSATNDFKLK